MTFHNNPSAAGTALAPDIYLPSNALTLLAALASALGQDHPAEIVYLDDDIALPNHVATGIRQKFPQIAFSVRSDRAAIDAFATLPKGFPDLIRRNIAPDLRVGLRRPANRPPEWLAPRYRTAHVYLTGKFVAKTLPGRCETIVLREEGLGNYYSLPFGPGKALLRMLLGRSPRRQIMGEEKWIDRIELSRPEALPPRLQAKASRLELADLLSRLPGNLAHEVVKVFWQGPLSSPVAGSALILSQPIDMTGVCSTEEKQAVYAAIRQRLINAGFAVTTKRHPRETTRPCPHGEDATIPAFFPIEAWPWLTDWKFDVAVALCTSALDTMGGHFSTRQLQLVDPAQFERRELGLWRERLDQWCAGLEGQTPAP